MRRILVVDDDRDALISITNVLRTEFPHLEILVASNVVNARDLAAKQAFDLVLANERLGRDLDGRVIPLRKPIDTEHLLRMVRDPPV